MVGNEHPFVHVRRKMVVARIEFMSRLAAFTPTQLTQSMVDDELSPLSIAHHLHEVDSLALQAMHSVQEQDNPLLPDLLEAPARSIQKKSEYNSLEAVLTAMVVQREQLFTYLASLSLSSWLRPCHFYDAELRTFYQLVSILPLHDQQHARQLAMLKARADF